MITLFTPSLLPKSKTKQTRLFSLPFLSSTFGTGLTKQFFYPTFSPFLNPMAFIDNFCQKFTSASIVGRTLSSTKNYGLIAMFPLLCGGVIKLNIDGCSKGNPSATGILRNSIDK